MFVIFCSSFPPLLHDYRDYAKDCHDSTHSDCDKWEYKCKLYGAL